MRHDPPNTDTFGWRGPARIVTVNVRDDNITVRFQGKQLDRRHQRVHMHVPFLVYSSAVIPSKFHQRDAVRRDVDNMPTSFMIVGVVFQQFGWHIAPHIRKYDGRRFLDAAFVFATQAFYFHNVVTVRARKGHCINVCI